MTEFADFLKAALTVGGVEWGDGTMILCIALAVQYQQTGRVKAVLCGIAAASALVPLVSIGAAAFLAAHVEQKWVHLTSALIMLVLAVLCLLAAMSSGEEKETWWDRLWARPRAYAQSKGPFWETFALFTIAEIPDRTSFAAAALQTSSGIDWYVTWAGAVCGLIVPNFFVIGIVVLAGMALPRKWLGYIASFLFLVGSVYMFYEFGTEYKG